MAENGIKMVATLYSDFKFPGVAQNCYKTCSVLVGNLLKEPTNDKFRKVNLDNNAIKSRIATVNGGLNILRGAGFVKDESGEGNFMVV